MQVPEEHRTTEMHLFAPAHHLWAYRRTHIQTETTFCCGPSISIFTTGGGTYALIYVQTDYSDSDSDMTLDLMLGVFFTLWLCLRNAGRLDMLAAYV
jgi:hypothetical protein